MASLVFVHGTGVREEAFKSTYGIIKNGLAKRRPDMKVVPCFWAEHLGARLHYGGKSIPTYDETKAIGGETQEEREAQIWALLYEDPLIELRLLALQKHKAEPLPPGKLSYSVTAKQDVAKLLVSPELGAAAADLGMCEAVPQAVNTVMKFNKLGDAVLAAKSLNKTVADSDDAARDAIARAIVASMVAYQVQASAPIPDADARDKLVMLIFSALGGRRVELKGIWGDILGTVFAPVIAIGKRGATWYLKNNRGAITNAVSPFPADILVYQAQGESIRQYIGSVIESSDTPTYVLAHSLGGIAAFDLVVLTPSIKVAGLVTVGSQAPFLYELGALTSLKVTEPLPQEFPRWLNFYDLNDILSYTGGGLFGDRVTDVQVRSGQPFPEAHSAYWTTDIFWDRLSQFIK